MPKNCKKNEKTRGTKSSSVHQLPTFREGEYVNGIDKAVPCLYKRNHHLFINCRHFGRANISAHIQNRMGHPNE